MHELRLRRLLELLGKVEEAIYVALDYPKEKTE
jgi:hypothetical protein